MLIVESKNIVEFNAIVEQLKASNITIVKTRTPGYFTLGNEVSIPCFLLFAVVLIGIVLGTLFIIIINSFWEHQVGNKPQNLSGIIGWLPVIFEITILFTALVYLFRFVRSISIKEEDDPIEILPNAYYCFLNIKDEDEKQYILKTFKEIKIIEC